MHGEPNAEIYTMKFTQLLVKKKTCQAKAKGSMCVTYVWGWDLCRVYMHGEPNAEIYTMKLLVKKKHVTGKSKGKYVCHVYI